MNAATKKYKIFWVLFEFYLINNKLMRFLDRTPMRRANV